MKSTTLLRYAFLFGASVFTTSHVTAHQPAVDSPPPDTTVERPKELSATEWKPRGLASPRNGVVFRPSSDGSLRSGRNAVLGGDGDEAARDQTAVLREQGMPKHLLVHYDAQTNSFYIAAKPDAAKSAPETAIPPPPVPTPDVPNLVISEFFVPPAKLVDAGKRTISLPSGSVTTVPFELWIPSNLLNTTEGPVQLPHLLESATPPPAGLRATDWKPEGIRSQRNQVTFRPGPNGILRSGKNANFPGGNGVDAAKDQTSILRGQGMPNHLEVHYDKNTNGFYISPKP